MRCQRLINVPRETSKIGREISVPKKLIPCLEKGTFSVIFCGKFSYLHFEIFTALIWKKKSYKVLVFDWPFLKGSIFFCFARLDLRLYRSILEFRSTNVHSCISLLSEWRNAKGSIRVVKEIRQNKKINIYICALALRWKLSEYSPTNRKTTTSIYYRYFTSMNEW